MLRKIKIILISFGFIHLQDCRAFSLRGSENFQDQNSRNYLKLFSNKVDQSITIGDSNLNYRQLVLPAAVINLGVALLPSLKHENYDYWHTYVAGLGGLLLGLGATILSKDDSGTFIALGWINAVFWSAHHTEEERISYNLNPFSREIAISLLLN